MKILLGVINFFIIFNQVKKLIIFICEYMKNGFVLKIISVKNMYVFLNEKIKIGKSLLIEFVLL